MLAVAGGLVWFSYGLLWWGFGLVTNNGNSLSDYLIPGHYQRAHSQGSGGAAPPPAGTTPIAPPPAGPVGGGSTRQQ